MHLACLRTNLQGLERRAFLLAPLPFLKLSQDCWRCLVSRSRRWKRSLLFQLFCSFFFLLRVFSSSVSLISSHCAHTPDSLWAPRARMHSPLPHTADELGCCHLCIMDRCYLPVQPGRALVIPPGLLSDRA